MGELAYVEASAFFLGVAAFLGVVDFLVAAFFAGAAGLAGALVTRPDLVFPSTFSTSTTAGAWALVRPGVDSAVDGERNLTAVAVLRLVAVLALVFGVVVFLVVVAFLGAAVALVAVFFGATAFLGAPAVLGAAAFFDKQVSWGAGNGVCPWEDGYTPWGQRAS